MICGRKPYYVRGLPHYGFSDLGLDVTAAKGNYTTETGIFHKGSVVHQLSGGEGCHGIKETGGCLGKVSDRHGIETLVRLEAVPPVPVPSLFHQPVRGHMMSCDCHSTVM